MRRDVALTLVSGAHGVYGLGTVPSEPRQWLRGACGHIECTISRFVYLLELEVASAPFRICEVCCAWLTLVVPFTTRTRARMAWTDIMCSSDPARWSEGDDTSRRAVASKRRSML